MSRARNAYRRAGYWVSGTGWTTEQPDPEEPPVAPEPEPQRYVPGVDTLRHGYTMRDLDRFARTAVNTDWSRGADAHERYETAWSAIAEALYAAEDPPTEWDLVAAGRDAIYAALTAHRHHHGYYRSSHNGGASGGPGTSPAFGRYWGWAMPAKVPSPEERVVDRLTVYQILPMLTDRQRELILTMGAFEGCVDDNGDPVDVLDATAKALGMTRNNVIVTRSHARRRFLLWWHEGEQPSRPWGKDARGQRRDATEVIRRRARQRTKEPARTRFLRPADERLGVYTGNRAHCPANHPYDEVNTYVDKLGHRHCRQCKRDRRRAAAAAAWRRSDSAA